MGELFLHPTIWTRGFFKGLVHPICPTCRAEIFPLTPVEVDELPDGRPIATHAKCGTVFQGAEMSDAYDIFKGRREGFGIGK